MNPPKCDEMDYINFLIAAQRGFEPELVAFDSWYSGLANLKLVRKLEWHWLTQLKRNRQVSVDRLGNRAISAIFIP